MITEMTMNFCFDQVSPACAILTDSDGFLLFLCRSSNSFSVFSTESRRDTCVPRAARTTGSDLATLATRFSVLRSPDRIGNTKT